MRGISLERWIDDLGSEAEGCSCQENPGGMMGPERLGGFCVERVLSARFLDDEDRIDECLVNEDSLAVKC